MSHEQKHGKHEAAPSHVKPKEREHRPKPKDYRREPKKPAKSRGTSGRPHIKIPGWVFAGVMPIYCELLLHIWTNRSIQLVRFVMVLLAGAAVGALAALVTSLFKRRPGKVVGIVFGSIASLLCIVEYFIHVTFQNFMPFSMMLAGGAGVATNLMSMVWDLIIHHVPHLIALIAPIVLFAVFSDGGHVRRGQRIGLLGAAVVLWAAWIVAVNAISGYSASMNKSYEFDSAVRCYGMYISLPLDIYQSNALKSDSLTFEPHVTSAQAPTPSPEPSQTTAANAPDATPEPTATPKVYNPHVLDVDFAKLAEEETNQTIASIHSYVAAQEPAYENDYTGLFAGKNLILISAEAFTGEYIDPELTPTLYRMVNKGIKFTHYYQPVWGAGTIGGEYANVVGMAPNGGNCMMSVTTQNMFLTMGHQLQAQGYTSAAFHDNDYTFYSRDQTHTHLGYDTFTGFGNGIEEGVTQQWTESDEEMFEFTLPQYIDKQPFSLYYMTVSGHSPYFTSHNAMAAKHYDEVKDMNHREQVKCYIATQLEIEASMTYLINALEEAGIADDTVIVLSADHYPYGLEYQDLSDLYGEPVTGRRVRDRNTLIIWSGCIEDMNLEVDDYVESLDILPTLSNLFGVDYDSRLLPGRDVFSDTTPLVMWYDGSWITDKGYYDSTDRVFIPHEGVDVSSDYADTMSTIVRNKLKYSAAVQQNNYFNYITPVLGIE